LARINGGVALAKSLRALGVREVFTLHGGHLDAFLVACADVDIRLTDTRHEASTGHAAEACARATGQIGKQNLAVVTLAPSAYHTVAEGFGCWAEQITRFDDIAPAVRRAQAQAVPSCLNIMTDPEVAHPATAMMIGRLDAEDEIAIPYYENIPLRP
jgi:thiamine pyrophosphate-dependent acetolactate synthase large subunit-like protein